MEMQIQQHEILEITRLHGEIEQSLKTSLQKAVRIGELLCKIKNGLKHGEFSIWIEMNLTFTDRMARNYMKLFENKDKILQAGNISQAYKMLEEPKTETVSDLILEELKNDAVSDLIKNEVRRVTIKKFKENITLQKETIQYAKEHPENVPIGEFKHWNVNGFHCKETITGQMNGFPIIHFEIIDPKYKELEELEEPYNHYAGVLCCTNQFKSLFRELRLIIKKFPERISFDAYKVDSAGIKDGWDCWGSEYEKSDRSVSGISTLGEKVFIYKELISEWEKLENIMSQIKQRLKVYEYSKTDLP